MHSNHHDDTAVKAQRFSNTKLLRDKRNNWKGSSSRRGFIEALKFDPDIVVTLEADGQHYPKDIPKLVNAVIVQDAAIVIGSRFTSGTAGIISVAIAAIVALGALILFNESRYFSVPGSGNAGFWSYWLVAFIDIVCATSYEANQTHHILLIYWHQENSSLKTLSILVVLTEGTWFNDRH